MDFRSAEEANAALVAMNNHPFDAKHTFKLNRFFDVEKYANMDEAYVEPELEEYTPRVRTSVFLLRLIYIYLNSSQEHLRAWLADPQGRDQYVVYRGEDVEIFWHGKPSQCELAYKPVRALATYCCFALINSV